MAHNPRHPYDEASDIVDSHFPSLRAANDIMRELFPAAAAADRAMAEAGLIPRHGRGWLAGMNETGGPPSTSRTPTVGPRGPTKTIGARGPIWVAGGSGPLRRGRGPSKLGKVIAADALRGQLRGYSVNIQTWAGLMEQNGVAGEVIYEAYEAAGGSPVLSAAQQRGNTSDFLHDFVAALEDLGVDPAIIAGTYKQAGGRIGDVDDARGGGGGRRDHGGPGGFLGDVTRGAGKAAAGAAGAVQDAVDQVKKVFRF